MKHIIFDILPSTILVASEASIAGFTVVWLGLSPFLAPLVWAWAAMMFGMVTAIVVGGIFFRQAFRVAVAEEELSASFDEQSGGHLIRPTPILPARIKSGLNSGVHLVLGRIVMVHLREL